MYAHASLCWQLLLLLAAGEWALGFWGVPPGSPLHASALAFLRIKALGAPATSLLLVSQVRMGSWRQVIGSMVFEVALAVAAFAAGGR